MSTMDPNPADHPDVSGDPDLADDADPATDPAVDDIDVDSARGLLDASDDPGSLTNDGLDADDDGDDVWEPPQVASPVMADGYTAEEESGRETLDDRLAQEVPEEHPAGADRDDADRDLRET